MSNLDEITIFNYKQYVDNLSYDDKVYVAKRLKDDITVHNFSMFEPYLNNEDKKEIAEDLVDDIDINDFSLFSPYLSKNSKRDIASDVKEDIEPHDFVLFEPYLNFKDKREIAENLKDELEFHDFKIFSPYLSDESKTSLLGKFREKINDYTFLVFLPLIKTDEIIKNQQRLNYNISKEIYTPVFGIEIETCYSHEIDFGDHCCPQNDPNNKFATDKDTSIVCSKGNPREFVLREPGDDMTTLKRDITYIKENSYPCDDNSCGFHVHMSSRNIVQNIYGKLFLVNLYIKWVTDITTPGTIPYNYSRKDSKHAVINTMPANIKELRNEFLSALIKFEKEEDPTKKAQIEINSRSIKDLVGILYPVKRKKYFNLNILPTVSDPNYVIHVEFRGHIGTTDYDMITKYVQYLQNYWKDVQNETNRMIDQASIENLSGGLYSHDHYRYKYMKYKTRYLKTKFNS